MEIYKESRERFFVDTRRKARGEAKNRNFDFFLPIDSGFRVVDASDSSPRTGWALGLHDTPMGGILVAAKPTR